MYCSAKRTALILTLLVGGLSLVLRAEEVPLPEESVYELEPLVVVATRTPLAVDRVSPSVSYIDGEAMEFWQDRRLTDVLQREAGVTIRSNGADGSVTSLFTRGTESNHTGFFLNGRRLPIAFSGQFNIESLSVENLQSVQFQKGAASVNYGSSGIGGVVDLQAASVIGEQSTSLVLQSEVGSNNAHRGQISGSLSDDKWGLTFSGSVYDTDNERENNASSGAGFLSKFDYLLCDDLSLEFISTYTNSDDELPGSLAFPSPTAWNENTYWLLSPGLRYSPDSGMSLHVFYALSKSDLEGAGPYSVTDDEIKTDELSLQSDINLSEQVLFTSGFLYRNEKLERKATGYANSGSQIGGFAQVLWQLNDRIELRAGLREDEYSDYDGSLTYNLESIYNLSKWNMVLFAKAATSYAPPTANDLAYDADLLTPVDPEESLSYEIGLQQKLSEEKLSWTAVLFRNEIEDLIDFLYLGFSNGAYQYDVYNVKKAKTQGMELGLSYEPTDSLFCNFNYTYLDTENEDGGRLLRRPLHAIQMSIAYDFSDSLRMGMSGYGYFDSDDYGGVDGDEYFVADFVADWNLNERVAVFGRVENLFDLSYEPADGYPALGRSVYFGARCRF